MQSRHNNNFLHKKKLLSESTRRQTHIMKYMSNIIKLINISPCRLLSEVESGATLLHFLPRAATVRASVYRENCTQHPLDICTHFLVVIKSSIDMASQYNQLLRRCTCHLTACTSTILVFSLLIPDVRTSDHSTVEEG